MRINTPEMMDAFYLGSGTVEEQFRYQAAMAVTREYVSGCSARYRKHYIERSLARIDRLTASASELKEFCKQTSRFRYVDDTLPILDTWEVESKDSQKDAYSSGRNGKQTARQLHKSTASQL